LVNAWFADQQARKSVESGHFTGTGMRFPASSPASQTTDPGLQWALSAMAEGLALKVIRELTSRSRPSNIREAGSIGKDIASWIQRMCA
jgi:hypothetical protein